MNNHDERQPVVLHAAHRNFVPARVEPVRQLPAVIDAPSWAVQAQPMPLQAAWTALDGAQERTSAMDRANALRLRLMPFVPSIYLRGGDLSGICGRGRQGDITDITALTQGQAYQDASKACLDGD